MIVFIVIAFLLLYFVISSYNSSGVSMSKGVYGEKIVARKLAKLNSKDYFVFNDILLKTNKGTSQIDHIVVSLYGIFILETKHYNGWIHGHQNSEYWTQTFYKKKTKFRNPIRQNLGHLYALKNILSEYKGLVFYPIVVFTGDAELKNVYSNVPILYLKQLLNHIKKENQKLVLSQEDMKNIIEKLDNVQLQEKQEYKRHIEYVKSNIQIQEQRKRDFLCPRCGGNLKLKQGSYGEFYSCSNYPKCRYTKNV